jgi:hypothetical protein
MLIIIILLVVLLFDPFPTTEAVMADKPEKAPPPGRWRHGRHGLLIHAR